jgi:hypothetical protein
MRTRLLAVGLATAAAVTIPIAFPIAAHAQTPQSNWECASGTAQVAAGVGIVTGIQCVNVGDDATAGQIEIPGGGYICSDIVSFLNGLIVEATGCFGQNTS